jgi:hypothetical protein
MGGVALRLAAATALLVALASVPAAAQTQPAPDTTTTPATTIPAGCTPPMPVALEFVGRVTAGDAAIARFAVLQVRRGQAGAVVDVDYSGNDDRRYIKEGHTYLVVAAMDPESSHFVSKVRRLRQEPKACGKYDPIFTNNADGSSIDSSILAGLHGRWRDVAGAFLLPTAIIFAVLIGLVIVKHTFLLTGRGVSYARRRHRERQGREAARGPRTPRQPADLPPPTGTESGEDAPTSAGSRST